jgi:hypothetical protein
MRRITHYEQRLRTLHYKKKFTIWLAEIRPKVRFSRQNFNVVFSRKNYEKSSFSLFPGRIIGWFCSNLCSILAKIYLF